MSNESYLVSNCRTVSPVGWYSGQINTDSGGNEYLSIDAEGMEIATISGTEGNIWVKGSFYGPTSFRVQRLDGRVWDFDQPGTKGLQYEAAEVARRVAAGETQSPRLTWDNTLEVLRTMDTIRSLVGVAYPGE